MTEMDDRVAALNAERARPMARWNPSQPTHRPNRCRHCGLDDWLGHRAWCPITQEPADRDIPEADATQYGWREDDETAQRTGERTP